MPDSVLTVRLFGEMEARIGDTPLTGLHLREGERLLAFLVLHHGTPQTYRKLAHMFWPSEAQQNDEYEGGDYPSTRQAIYALRKALGLHAWRLSSVGKGVVQLDLQGSDVDTLEFERLVIEEDEERCRRAVEIYRAPVLEFWNEEWIKEPRARFLRSRERIGARLTAMEKLPGPPANAEAARLSADNSERHETAGGAVPLNSPLYIERETDTQFQQALTWRESIVLVKGARQIGKTSLLARGLQHARKAGARIVMTDFQSLDESSLVSSDALYRTLAQEMADQLDLDILPEQTWNDRRSAGRNLERYLCDVALGEGAGALIWGMDVVDRLFGYACGSEAFGLFRSWHNRRALDPDGPWPRLTLAISYATEAHLFIADQNRSPFNVGVRLTLSDFSRAQIAELNERHGSPLRNDAELNGFYGLVGGHPYLVRCGLAAIAAQGVSIAEMEDMGLREEGPFGDHLRRLRLTLQQNPVLTEMMWKVLKDEPDFAIENFYRLRSAGLITGDRGSDARPRCRLYAAYLSRHLSGR